MSFALPDQPNHRPPFALRAESRATASPPASRRSVRRGNGNPVRHHHQPAGLRARLDRLSSAGKAAECRVDPYPYESLGNLTLCDNARPRRSLRSSALFPRRWTWTRGPLPATKRLSEIQNTRHNLCVTRRIFARSGSCATRVGNSACGWRPRLGFYWHRGRNWAKPPMRSIDAARSDRSPRFNRNFSAWPDTTLSAITLPSGFDWRGKRSSISETRSSHPSTASARRRSGVAITSSASPTTIISGSRPIPG